MRLRRRESFNAVDRGPDYLMLIDKVPSMAASQDKMQRRIGVRGQDRGIVCFALIRGWKAADHIWKCHPLMLDDGDDVAALSL
tara:strand:- start:387 stop:635 length:249 start_codon:yes stop_codon:yes gene_type:complete